jgi:hypothetical protein
MVLLFWRAQSINQMHKKPQTEVLSAKGKTGYRSDQVRGTEHCSCKDWEGLSEEQILTWTTVGGAG